MQISIAQSKGRGVGFYVMIEEDEEVEERCLEVKEGDLGGDVYKVERVVERRTKLFEAIGFIRISLLYK